MPGKITVVEVSPIKASALLWRPAGGQPVLTVICKATYDLVAGTAALAEVQDDVNLRDLHKENNPNLGLHSASDLVPFKPHADVTLVGKAYAPPRELAKSVIARVALGSVDKRVAVHAERFMTRDGRVQDDKFFSKMPIGYERAAGGPDTANPVGRHMGHKPDTTGRVPLPNLQRPGEAITSNAPITPVGFGPISPSWPERQRLFPHGKEWSGDDWLKLEVPKDVNWAYFNVAPEDQRLDEIRADETIHLEHLHPEESKLDCKLPGVMPYVFIERSGGAHRVHVKGDTLWIDTNRLVQTLTWRAQVPLDAAGEEVRVIVAMQEPGKAKPSWDQAWAAAEAQAKDKIIRSNKTKAQAPASLRAPSSRNPAAKNLTSPVQLVPVSDHMPGWMPSPSSAGSMAGSAPMSSDTPPGSGLYLELMLSIRETAMLKQLCHAMGYDAVDMLRYALRESHAARFGQDEEQEKRST